MTPEEIYRKYHDTEPVIGEVTEVRVSPNRLRVARQIPDDITRGNYQWVSVYFIDGVGLTITLLSDEEVADWRVFREGVSSGQDAEPGREGA